MHRSLILGSFDALHAEFSACLTPYTPSVAVFISAGHAGKSRENPQGTCRYLFRPVGTYSAYCDPVTPPLSPHMHQD